MRPKKRSFAIKGHRTSLSLEEPFWSALKELAAEEGQSLADVVSRIDAERGDTGLSTAVRIYILERYRRGRAGRDPEALPASQARTSE